MQYGYLKCFCTSILVLVDAAVTCIAKIQNALQLGHMKTSLPTLKAVPYCSHACKTALYSRCQRQFDSSDYMQLPLQPNTPFSTFAVVLHKNCQHTLVCEIVEVSL